MEDTVFELLKTSPDMSVEQIREKLDREIKTWKALNNKRVEGASIRCEVLLRLKAEMESNPQIFLTEHAERYKTKKNQQKVSLQNRALQYKFNNVIDGLALNELAKEFELFSKEEILSIINARLIKKKEFKYKETIKGKKLEDSRFKKICEMLGKIGKKDLYQFLNVPHHASKDQIEQRKKTLYNENYGKAAGEEKSIKSKLLGYCETVLLNDTERIDYDYSISLLAFSHVGSVIETLSKGSMKVIHPEQYKSLLEECTRNGMNVDKAEYMIYSTAEKNKVSIIEPSDIGEMPICRFCGSINDKGAKFCKDEHCGMPINVICPACGKESTSREELRCTGCGFVIGDMPKAVSLLDEAEKALVDDKVEKSTRCWESAKQYWKTYPRLSEVQTKIEEVRSKVNSIKNAVKQLCCQHLYFKAQIYLNQIGDGNETVEIQKEVENAIKKATELVEKAKRTNDFDEQVELYCQALSLCADCQEAQNMILQMQLPTPLAIGVEAKGNSIRVKWNKLKSNFIEYRIIRKEGGCPTSIKDGVHLADTSNTQFDDTNVKIGVSYFYAIYSKCGEIFSKTALVSDKPALVVGDIDMKKLSYDIQEKSIGFNMVLPKNAKSIKIYRDGTLVKTTYGSSYIDTGLIPDQVYHYKFVVVFEDSLSKLHESNGLTIKLKPVAPPSPVRLNVVDGDKEAKLNWSLPDRGTLSIFVSENPLPYHINDIVNLDVIKLPKLNVTGTSCTIVKNFTGERFFLPVTIQGNIGVAGNQVGLLSVSPVLGVTMSKKDSNVNVQWQWNGVVAVRICYAIDGCNEQKKDIYKTNNAFPLYEISVPKLAKSVVVKIMSLAVSSGKEIVGKPVEKFFNMKPTNVSFVSVVNKKKFGIIPTDEYIVKLKADAFLPCNLHVLTGEKDPPVNRNQIPAVVIEQSELKPETLVTIMLHYNRKMKDQKVHFRIIAANKEFDEKIKIVPETRHIV